MGHQRRIVNFGPRLSPRLLEKPPVRLCLFAGLHHVQRDCDFVIALGVTYVLTRCKSGPG